jgi:hypothetical protein
MRPVLDHLIYYKLTGLGLEDLSKSRIRGENGPLWVAKPDVQQGRAAARCTVRHRIAK